jgi:hypothetical protein
VFLLLAALAVSCAAHPRHDPPVAEPLPDDLPSPGLDVEIRVADLDPQGLLGQSELIDGRFVVTLDDDLSPEMRTEVLVHEWAHLLVWGASDQFGDHGPTWGVAYAWVYRCVVDPDPGRGGSGESEGESE